MTTSDGSGPLAGTAFLQSITYLLVAPGDKRYATTKTPVTATQYRAIAR